MLHLNQKTTEQDGNIFQFETLKQILKVIANAIMNERHVFDKKQHMVLGCVF